LPDIDSVDKDNPLAAAEYANSIYNYYRRVEPQFSVSYDYMKSQVSDSSAE
jgi:cyclin B